MIPPADMIVDFKDYRLGLIDKTSVGVFEKYPCVT